MHCFPLPFLLAVGVSPHCYNARLIMGLSRKLANFLSYALAYSCARNCYIDTNTCVSITCCKFPPCFSHKRETQDTIYNPAALSLLHWAYHEESILSYVIYFMFYKLYLKGKTIFEKSPKFCLTYLREDFGYYFLFMKTHKYRVVFFFSEDH